MYLHDHDKRPILPRVTVIFEPCIAMCGVCIVMCGVLFCT